MITAAIQAIAGLSLRTKIESAVVVLAVAGGALYWVTRLPAPVPEDTTPAPMVRQADGSLEASRVSTTASTPPPHLIPRGYKETSRATATVAPSPEAAASGCPPVRLVLSTTFNGTSRRIIASSPDGVVIAAKDEIIEAILMPAPALKSAIGLSYGTDRAVGVWAEHDIGRLRLGAEVSKGSGKPRAELRVGITF